MFEINKKQLVFIVSTMLLLLSFATTAICQPLSPASQLIENPIKIEGQWRVMQGDNPDFKKTDYDDGAWQTLEVPSNVQETFPNSGGFIWYRKWVYISQDKPLYTMGIRLGKIATTDQAFVNGHMIGSSGQADSNSLDNKKIRVYQIPNGFLNFGEYNLITIRVGQVYNDTSGIYSEEVSIGDYSTLVNQLIQTEAISLVFIGSLLIVGFMALLRFIKKPGAKEYLFFAIGIFSLAIYTFYISQWRYLLGVESICDVRLFYAAYFSMVPAFLRFTYEYLEDEAGSKVDSIFNYFTQGLILYGAFLNVLLLIYKDKYFWQYLEKMTNDYISLVAGFIVISYLLYKSATGDKDNRIITFASALAFILGILELAAWNLNLSSNMSMWGLILFLLVITMVLANRFFRLRKEVEQYSTGLDNMVHKGTKKIKLLIDSHRHL